MKPNQWMTIDQLCEELAICRSTFEDWRRKGQAPPMIQLPNRKYRISRTEFNYWVATLEVMVG
jgi:excisionase family DNA binding protein